MYTSADFLAARAKMIDQEITRMENIMKPNDIVRFKYPDTVKEAELLFVVLEVREARILVKELEPAGLLHSPQYIAPTFVYSAHELEPVTFD